MSLREQYFQALNAEKESLRKKRIGFLDEARRKRKGMLLEARIQLLAKLPEGPSTLREIADALNVPWTKSMRDHLARDLLRLQQAGYVQLIRPFSGRGTTYRYKVVKRARYGGTL